MQTIVSIDPGVTTGFVVAELTDTTVSLRPVQHKFIEIDLYNYLSHLNPDIIICESFEYRSRHKDDVELFSRNLIGVVNLYTQQQERVKCLPLLYMQKPSTGEGGYFAGQRALSELGIYLPEKKYHHAMSAMRHLMYWLNFGAGFQYNKKQQLNLVLT